ncbi:MULTISPECIES: peptidoglycan -binding protein [Lentibacter]|jgi:chemotaxis protein MotB|uniref:Chemotaxis protein MotB n=1 Tax=Lentibacter algarum TaxID=576131 RepID=A0A1H3HAN2_9RHOB|nr:peptidoglycan -binding protein [Lentibacter algarum]MCO4777417.1 peptidoglycan -binding protein [Lentibacter algarum]MCO4827647.1 peptidoglycan -binding protein [Lentibacter algarum]WIF30753.1 outer membrane protein-like protein [Lentibacter algarum]SDY11844.1 chemotaxis protein MotB [Lentibacter algarum]
MALSRRTGQRFQANIWPGFVDAMTGLLLVLMFVLTIFMVVQFVLRETITGQESEMNQLNAEIAKLAQALGLEQRKTSGLEARVGELGVTLEAARTRAGEQAALIATLRAQTQAQDEALSAAEAQITGFEAQVASLLAERNLAQSEAEALRAESADLSTQKAALEAVIAAAEAEAAAKDEALARVETALSEEEAARAIELAAAEALRARLAAADTELTAMTLALEAARKDAEETLTLLAAAEAKEDELGQRIAALLLEAESEGAAQAEMNADMRAKLAQALAEKLALEGALGETLSETEARAVLLAQANAALSEEEARSAEALREQALLNQQVAALRAQLGSLQAIIDDYKERDAASDIQLSNLGQDLNAALARAAAEERKRRELEEAERVRLEAEKQNLERYRSEFFGRLRDVIGAQDGVRIVGDRFVFSSEVLFAQGAANLSGEGQGELAKIAGILRNVVGDIPDEIDWVIRVDGHTDNVPLSGAGAFADNWELSQARALSVVRYMVNFLDIPPERLSANGFGQYQPIANGNSPEARAQNRRIELKFTEK